MSTPDVRAALQNPGRICHTPTDLSTDYPHGGTAMGEVAAAYAAPNYTTRFVSYEAFGTAVTEVIHTGESWVLSFALRAWDSDGIAACFVNTAVGTTTGHQVVHGGGTKTAGTLLSSLSKVLVFSPYNADLHPMVVMYKGAPMVEETAQLALRLGTDLLVPVMWRAIQDGTGQQVRVGLRADLSL